MGFIPLIAIPALLCLVACRPISSPPPSQPVILRVSTKPIGKSIPVLRAICDQFERDENVRVEFYSPQMNVSDLLGVTRQFLEAQSPDVDVVDIDVIWPSILGEHLLDLSQDPGFRASDFVPSLIQNNTVGGRLVAIPWYIDMAFLYTRTDLMAEAGTTVPRTYQDFPAVARAFEQLRERKAADGATTGPWPLAMNLEPQEGLTCIALEWFAASGAGPIMEADEKVSFRPQQVTQQLHLARTWIGTLFAPEAPQYTLNQIEDYFLEGKVAMMRNWTHAYAPLMDPQSPLAGKVEVHPLPEGPSGRFHVLGGFQMAVSKYSRHPELAKRLVARITGEQGQRRHALEAGFLPSRPALWKDPQVAKALPHLRTLMTHEAVNSLIVRPSRQAGPRYNELSSSIYEEVGRVLVGAKTPEEATRDMIEGVRVAMRR